jgi:hypothetical protein
MPDVRRFQTLSSLLEAVEKTYNLIQKSPPVIVKDISTRAALPDLRCTMWLRSGLTDIIFKDAKQFPRKETLRRSSVWGRVAKRPRRSLRFRDRPNIGQGLFPAEWLLSHTL